MNVTEEVIAEFVKLALAAGLNPLLVILGLLVMAVALVVAKRLPEPPPAEPDPVSEWNTDPANGAVVTPNDEPGGWPDGKVN